MRATPTGVNQLALALIGAGTLWLMLQLGFVPESLSAALARWWPLLLVAAGAGLTFPRLGVAPALVIGSAAILLFSLVGLAPRVPSTMGSVVKEMPAVARSALFEVELGSPATTLTTSPNTALLFEARFSGPIQGAVASSGQDQPRVTLAPQRTLLNPFGPSGSWDLTLPATLPLRVALEASSGTADIDLSRALLRDLLLHASSGAVRLALPATAFQAELRAGSGLLEVDVPTGASADLTLHLASGATTLTVGAGADALIELHTRSGRLELELPPSAPIRLTIDRDASGSVTIPDYLTRRSGRGDVGVWESRALFSGGRLVDVRIASVGSGAIVVR